MQNKDMQQIYEEVIEVVNKMSDKEIKQIKSKSNSTAHDRSLLKALNERFEDIMGTNYYLLKKENYKKDLIRVKYGLAGFDRVREKENGYFFEGKYYKNISELNKDYYEKYHIGKKSAGWRFLLCSYPELKIKTLNDWKELFKSSIIVDEYGDRVSINKICDLIENTKHETADWTDYELELTDMHTDKYGLGIHENRPGCEIFINKDTYDITSNPCFD